MGKLTKDEVKHIADLSDLILNDKQIDKFSSQLSNIVDYIGNLSEVNTKGLEPTSQTTGLENVQREDVLKDSPINQDDALSGTENTYNGYFKVKAILSERTDK